MPGISNFVNTKFTESGDAQYSIRLDKYTRDMFKKMLEEAPDKSTIIIGPSKYAPNGIGAYWLPPREEAPVADNQVF